ncbi:MAG TPA: FAD-linked oxidase C-terminal domain-containing protein [Microbacteriaceae bacterium]|nr:FAD-linked oxidase C-terminal domain-containing protein [Microbacteriaceae bacterium]HQX35242.1 FAD-linked oxidase C-terminal domain-containing protein [Microbacteriaceae bacterium]HQZ48650.1 FAD-linked oxidase C-terminal domain-containing protein [Microbacteriaceae bacterium]HRA09539.1 FAD-linked oxidase C-terminal domain-containing protein [Microbacteriaceae bacterium]
MLPADTSLIDALVAALPEGSVITNPASMDAYRWDRANDPNAGTPLVVVRVTSTEEVQTVVRLAAAANVPIVPRGAGSGLSGGSTAINGCIVLSLDRMREITVDPVTRTVVSQPGAFNAEVKAAAAEHGLWYPPDPASFQFCSIGGNVATNAGGLCCVKYGVTTDYVLGMTVVLSDGRAVKLGGPKIKDVAGYSLTKLFTGSEGTLGIITEVVLRLIPAQRPPTTLVATFATLEDAMSAVLGITQAMRPSMLEFMDRVSINAVEDVTKMGLDRTAAAMLVVQSDEPAGHAGVEIAQVEALCALSNATECFFTDDLEEGEAFVVARRIAIPSVEKMGTVLMEDVGVPLPRLGDLVMGIEQISQHRDVIIAVIAHAGDGNTHPLLVVNPNDPAQQARAEIAYGEVMDLAISLGGTITGEHGVGRLKKPWLADYLGPDVLELNHRIKTALDPAGILNPGAVLDETWSTT